MAKDFKSLTLSDFYLMTIGIRGDGTATPIIDATDGNAEGLAGYYGDPKKSDNEIREEAYQYYKDLMQKLSILTPENPLHTLLNDEHKN